MLFETTDEMIIARQKQWAFTYNSNIINNKLIENINNELISSSTDFTNEVNEKVVENIEKNFQGLKEKFEKAQKEKGFSFDVELKKLIASYQSIINKISSLQTDGNIIEYNKLSAIDKSFFKLQTDIRLLEQWLESGGGKSYADLAKLRIADQKTQNAHFIKVKRKNSPSLINQLAGIGTALKGLELENLAVKKLASKIPDNNNYAAVNTGAIKISTSSGLAISIKEDISLFDLSMDLEIPLINGEIITIKELIQRCQNNDTIILDSQQDGYKKLQQAMVMAISAKSTNKKNKISFHTGLTTNSLLNNYNIEKDQRYWSLYHLWQLKTVNKNLKDDKNYRESLINYNMSKALDKIIGKKNYMMVTKEGFMPMGDFILNELYKENYIRVNKPLLDGSMKVEL